MGDVIGVAIKNGLHDLFENECCIILAEKLLGDNVIEELTASTQLANQMHILLIFKVLVKLDDVWVVELL